jgi:hypothetical protein
MAFSELKQVHRSMCCWFCVATSIIVISYYCIVVSCCAALAWHVFAPSGNKQQCMQQIIYAGMKAFNAGCSITNTGSIAVGPTPFHVYWGITNSRLRLLLVVHPPVTLCSVQVWVCTNGHFWCAQS